VAKPQKRLLRTNLASSYRRLLREVNLGDQLDVIAYRSVVQAALDDLAPKRVQFVGEEVLELVAEEVVEHSCPFVVSVSPDLGLSVDLQEPAGDESSFDL
jgi:hypothetical protein